MTGATSRWSVVAESGLDKTHSFCPVCGTPVYVEFAAAPEAIAVHAGSLDDPGKFNPRALTYAIRGQVWDRIDPSLQAFERMPPS
jgi:hypothetical protein